MKKLPQDWEWKKIGEICNIYNGSTPSKTNSDYWENGEISWFTIDDIRQQGKIINYTNQKITELALKETSVKLLPKNTVLLCCTASVGVYALTKIPLTTNQQFNGLVIKKEYADKVLPEFLMFVCSRLAKDLDKFAGVTSFKFVSVKSLSSIDIPMPSLKIQKHIISILEKVEKLKEKRQITNEGTNKIIQSVFYEMFGDPVKNEKGWEIVNLGEIGKISMCKRIFKEQTLDKGDIPFYKIGTFGKEPDAFISKKVYEEYKQKFSFPKQGDILLSASGTIGRRVVYDGKPAYFQDSNIVWVENNEKKVLNGFLYHVYGFIKWQTDTSTIARLYNKNLIKTKIIIPTITLQKEFVKIAQLIESLKEKQNQSTNDINQLFDALMQKAFNGELVE